MAQKNELLRRIAFVVRCSCSAVFAYTLARALHLSYPIWALISSIVVSQEQLAETWTSTGRRIAGTILGVAVALSVHAVASYFAARMVVQVVLSVAICAAIVHKHPAMRVSMWTCAIVLLTGTPADPMFMTGLYRGSEVILGGLIGGTLHHATEKLLDFAERMETKSASPEGIEPAVDE